METTAYKIQLEQLSKGITPLELLASAVSKKVTTIKEVAEKINCHRTTAAKALKKIIPNCDGLYVMVPQAVLSIGLKPTEALLASLLLSLEGQYGQAIICNRSLCELLGVALSTLKRTKRSLINKGLLRIKKRFFNGWQVANRYFCSHNMLQTAVEKAIRVHKWFSKNKWVKNFYSAKAINKWVHNRASELLFDFMLQSKQNERELEEKFVAKQNLSIQSNKNDLSMLIQNEFEEEYNFSL